MFYSLKRKGFKSEGFNMVRKEDGGFVGRGAVGEGGVRWDLRAARYGLNRTALAEIGLCRAFSVETEI